ncbi:MAG: EI24 domain-containing protein [Crocinitomicaceae bacterium]
MSILNQINQVLTAFLGSLKFVVKYKLYLFFLPAIVLAILFYLGMKSGASISGKLSFMENWWVIGWLVKWLISGIKAVSFLFFEITILVLLTPINSYFAEKVKEDLTGVKVEFGWGQFVGSLWRSIQIFAVAFAVEISLIVLLWILSFAFGDWFYTIISFTVSSFFIGFSFFDFALELDFKKSKESWKWGQQNKILSLVAGLIFSVAIYIPEETGFLILFLITISLVPHMLTIATTQVYFKNFSQKKAPESDDPDAGDIVI